MWVPLIITNNFCKKNFCQKGQEGLDLDTPISPKHPKPPKFCRLKIGMWGVYPEAIPCNVDGLCSDFDFCERI